MSAVIYARISDDPRGKAAGVDRQVRECRDLAAARDLTVAEVLIDNDISATKGKRRPGFDRVLELIQAGAVDTVVVWHTDRLYRLPRDLEPIIALADGRALRFATVTASEIDLNTPSGRMVARMLAAASAQEVEHKADRQRSASDDRARHGIPHGAGYGFRRDGDALTVHPEEAALIRELTGRVLDGESLRNVARDLNTRGIPSPAGKSWATASIRQLLLRPSLAGLRQHRGQIVGRGNGDSILTEDERIRLVALLTDPARRNSPGTGRAPRHFLSGVALCGRCGGVMRRLVGWTPPAGSKSKATAPAYSCAECHRVRIKQDHLDDYVAEVIVQRLERSDAAAAFPQDDPSATILARDDIATIDAKLAEAADLFAAGTITGAQLTRITTTLRAERQAAQEALQACIPPAIPADALGERARAVWDGLDLDRRRAILGALMTVTVQPGGVGQRGFDPVRVAVRWK